MAGVVSKDGAVELWLLKLGDWASKTERGGASPLRWL
jgi:hypothetical protein